MTADRTYRLHDDTFNHAYYSAFACISCYILVTIMMYTRRRKSPYLAGRLFWWTLAQALTGYLAISATAIRTLWPALPCFIQLWIANFAGITFCWLFIARSAKFYFQFKVSHAKLFGAGLVNYSNHPTIFEDDTSSLNNVPIAGPNTNPSLASASVSKGKSLPQARSSNVPPSPSGNNPMFNMFDDAFVPLSGGGSMLRGAGGLSPSTSLSQFESSTPFEALSQNWYWIHRSRVADSRLLKIYGVVMISMVLMLIVVQIKTTEFPLRLELVDWSACASDWEFFPVLFYLFAFEFIACPIIFWKFREARDNCGIRTELFITIIVGMPCWAVYLCWGYVPNSWLSIWLPSTWYIVSLIVSHTSAITIPLILSYRNELLRKKMVFLYNMESFAKVLSDKVVWEEFKLYMAADFCVENALFYEAYQELIVQAASALTREGVKCTGMPLHGSALAKSTIRGANLFADIMGKRRTSNVPPLPGNSTSVTRSPSGLRLSSSIRNTTPTSSGTAPTTQYSQSMPGPSISEDQVSVAGLAFADAQVPESAKQHYRAFFETYLTQGAPYEVNLPSIVRDTVVHAFNQDKIHVGIFDTAKEEVVQSMFLNTFPNFLHASHAKHPIKTTSGGTTLENAAMGKDRDDSLEAGIRPAPAAAAPVKTSVMREVDA
ncbi:hypothetical protein PhCBS80983_g03874 [Powellomyces hirtus]|uniref:RGS domain-containing protein n=1 Tax=Powellomyces hirtus TaxID=109895 RepID=A0A507E0W9_9FUNG|nr:hypothetical protein PhCBS80983_g03874 [Powellomyces hirtus]